MTISGTSGDDTLLGTAGDDVFNMSQGGNDSVKGLGGNDTFSFGAAFTSADQVNGGGGNDTLKLNGDTTATFQTATLVSIEKIVLLGGHHYNLQLIDANVAAGHHLTLDASALGAGDSLAFNGQAESDGNLTLLGGSGNDQITGGLHHTVVDAGDGEDFVNLYGGVNIVDGGAGNDSFYVHAPISSSSRFDGGTGTNQIIFDGDFSAGQTIGAHWNTNIADMALSGGHSYKMTLQNGLVAAGQTQGLFGNQLLSTDTLWASAAQLTTGNVVLQGGHGDDVLIGGAGDDTLEGRQGADKMTGHGGADRFAFNGVGDSTGATFDRVTDFDAASDRLGLDLSFSIGAVDPSVTTGTLSTTNVDAKLTAEIGAAQLQVHHAVLFTPTSGNLSGHIILVIDANGTAGYQAEADYVIDVTGMTGTLSTSDFQ